MPHFLIVVYNFYFRKYTAHCIWIPVGDMLEMFHPWSHCLYKLCVALLTLACRTETVLINQIYLNLFIYLFMYCPTVFGARNGHQTPALTSLLLVWFRYHNHLARQIAQQHPDWRDEFIYQSARRRVIATWQVGHSFS